MGYIGQTVITPTFHKFKKIIDQRVEDYGAPYIAFGVFGIINYPVFYFVWRYVYIQSYSSFLMRAVATLLSLGLLLHKYWPRKLQSYLPLYWYATLLFCMPFFFTFMFFQNHGTSVWAFNLIPISVFLMLLTDWASGSVLLVLGTALGALVSYVKLGHLTLVDNFDAMGFFSNYIFSAIIGFFFMYSYQTSEKERVQTVKSIGSSIAHELRTPLLTIRAGAAGIKNLITKPLAQEGSVNIDIKDYDNFIRVMTSIEMESCSANMIINMLLMKIHNDPRFVGTHQTCSILKVIDLALMRYPFQEQQRQLIIYNKEIDFLFQGNELLTIHILFNLLKNSLYYIEAAGKGCIEIKAETGKQYNFLYFRDTGKGIPKKIIPHVFDKFFSRTHNGTGLGLWFCRMVMKSYGGDIVCRSVEHEFTEFLLKFPIKR